MTLIIGAMFLTGLYWIATGLGMLFSKGSPKQQDFTRFTGLFTLCFGLWATIASAQMLSA